MPVEMGDTFGRLIVVGRAEPYIWEAAHRRRQIHKRVTCRCACGAETIVRESSLRSGNTVSCGCLKDENIVLAQEGARKWRAAMAGKNNAGKLARLRDERLVGLMEQAKQRSAPVAEGFTRDAARTETGK